jgi:hypothetical protein
MFDLEFYNILNLFIALYTNKEKYPKYSRELFLDFYNKRNKKEIRKRLNYLIHYYNNDYFKNYIKYFDF